MLVLGDDGGDPWHASHACMVTTVLLNSTIVTANSQGFIGNVSCVVPGNTPKKTYQLCFKDASANNSTGTGGATFTVI